MLFLLDLAWRDLRASGRSLWVFCACLVLGVTLVSASGGLYRLINISLLADTRILLGGDLEVDSDKPLPDEAIIWMTRNGDVSLVTEVDTMLGTQNGRFLRVELQAVDEMYPLYGELVLEPFTKISDITRISDGIWGIAIDPALAERLGVKVGNRVFIGDLEMEVRALVLKQPDRSLNADWRGTPVLMSNDALLASGLIQPGSRVDYEYHVRTSKLAEVWQAEFYEAFPHDNWRVRTFADRSQRIAERLGQIASGLIIIGFSTLFIGGLGVFNSIQAYLQGKLKTIATLRALGLRNRRLAIVYLSQIAILGGGSSLLGVLIGGAMAIVGGKVVAVQVPLTISIPDLVLPGIIALCFGLLTAFAFALPAIGRALETDPALLFRGHGQKAGKLSKRWWIATLMCITAIIVLVMLVLPDKIFAVGFVVVVAGLLLVLNMIVRVIQQTARSLDQHPVLNGRFTLKLALANLHRPGNALRTSLLSLGSALTLLVACTLVVASLVRSISSTIPEHAPGLVLYDILSSQVAPVVEALEQDKGVKRIDIAPLVQARISALDGRELKEINELDTAQRRDSSQNRYKLSYLTNNIDSVTVVEGEWWSEPVNGIARLAVEDREAGKLGLQVGNIVTFSVEDRSFDAEVAAIYSQKGMQTRFWFEGILSEGALDSFIHRHVGAVYVDDTNAIAIQNRIAEIAPNAITVRTASLLKVARELLSKAGAGLSVVAGISLLASLLVLISVMAAGRSRQIYDATILHSLGVRMESIKRSLQLEYLLLAIISSGFAVTLGSAIAIPLLTLRLKLPSADLIWLAAAVAIFVSSLALGLGAAYLLGRLKLRPAVLLRDPG